MNSIDLDDSRLVRLAEYVPDVVTRKDYGRAFLTMGDDTSDPTSGRVSWVPEGLLVRAGCRDCDRHFERAIDLSGLGSIDPHGPPPTEESSQHLTRCLRPTFERLSNEWLPRHRPECGVSEARLPDELLDLESEHLEEATRDLSRGQPVLSQAVLLFGSGNRLSVQFQPAVEVKADDREESHALVEEGKAGVRQFLHRSDEELVGAVFIGETWVSRPPFGEVLAPPSEDSERDEGVIVQAFTRSTGRTRFFGIEREVPGSESGPGQLNEQLSVPGVGGRFPEGLLAVVEEAEPPGRDGESWVDRAMSGVH